MKTKALISKVRKKAGIFLSISLIFLSVVLAFFNIMTFTGAALVSISSIVFWLNHRAIILPAYVFDRESELKHMEKEVLALKIPIEQEQQKLNNFKLQFDKKQEELDEREKKYTEMVKQEELTFSRRERSLSHREQNLRPILEEEYKEKEELIETVFERKISEFYKNQESNVHSLEEKKKQLTLLENYLLQFKEKLLKKAKHLDAREKNLDHWEKNINLLLAKQYKSIKDRLEREQVGDVAHIHLTPEVDIDVSPSSAIIDKDDTTPDLQWMPPKIKDSTNAKRVEKHDN